jgi:hypothetical protein
MPQRIAAGVQGLSLVLLLGAAFGNLARAQGSATFDGQYMGQLRLTKVVSGDCTQPPAGSLFPLTVSDGQVEFKYVPRFDTILRGRIDGNGNFRAAQRVREGFVSMTGHIEDNKVIADISSPSCRYSFRSQ